MRPDTMWSGVTTDDGKYWTSRSKYDRDQKARGVERITSLSDLEASIKMADEGKKSKKEKAAKARRKVIEKVFAGIDDATLRESAFDSSGRFKGSRPERAIVMGSEQRPVNIKENVQKD